MQTERDLPSSGGHGVSRFKSMRLAAIFRADHGLQNPPAQHRSFVGLQQNFRYASVGAENSLGGIGFSEVAAARVRSLAAISRV